MENNLNIKNTVEEYINREDWRIKANANSGYSIGGLINNSAGKIIANYWLNEVYTEDISDAHRSAAIHIHDLDMLSGYCCGHSLRALLYDGFNGVANRVEAKPPKHLSSALSQCVNFLITLQSEWAGAMAFSSFDTFLAPYIKIDNLDYEQVKQEIQQFIYDLNFPSRCGNQAPFTNLTFDLVCPEDLKNSIPLVGGEYVSFSYGELQKEMDMINMAFTEVMMDGDAKGRPFTFPIPTYNITEDFDWDSKVSDNIFNMTRLYGLPYFQNFLNSDLKPTDIRSMCCRLQLDLTELKKRGNGLFGSAEQTGSLGVVTLNLAHIGYRADGNERDLFAWIEYYCNLAKQSLELKREALNHLLENGLFPYTKRYIGTYRNFFNTIGINGMNECIKNFSFEIDDITTENGKKLAVKILDFIRGLVVKFQEETGHMYNLEATPAEGTTYRFAKEDQKNFKYILQAGTKEAPYYTNSSQLPVGYTDDLFAALEHQEVLQQKYTGGTVFHAYIGENIGSVSSCKKLVKNVLSRFRIPYFTITPTFSICDGCGYINGEHEHCPSCGNETEVWTRVMGYFRPKQSFNKGKVSEFEERKYFN